MKKNQLRRLLRYFDARVGLAGGIVMAMVVFFINFKATNDLPGSLTASLKKGTYTFFFGGLIMKLCSAIALRWNPAVLAIFFAMVIPSCIAVGLTFGVHSLRGTPLPVESTMPTVVFVFPSTLIWGWISRARKTSGKTS
jgi:hypothetical protein